MADPLTTLVVPTVPLSEEVPLALPPKVDELIGQALADRGALKVVSLARATASGGVIAGARDAAATLARAKAAYSAFRFADAVRDFDGLADLIEEAGSPPTDGEALTAALVGSAMANEAAGRPVAVKASCRRLMTLRPGYQLDRVRVPPSVVKACDTEAVELARAGKRSVVITSLPALAQVYVDGVLRGTTPLSIQVGVGRHGLIVAREDRLPFREVLVVEPGAEALRRSIDLKADPIPALARLQDALSQRGPLPHTLKLAVELARAASVEQILVLGVQPAGAGREGWRVLGAALPARGGTPTSRAGAVLDASLANASDVCGFLAERLAGVTEAVAMPPDDALNALEGFDFDGAIFGRAPQPAVAAGSASRSSRRA